MQVPDLSALTLGQLISTFLFFTAVDTVYAWVIALVNKTFSVDYALDFLRTHVALKGAPILGLAILGTGVPQVGVPAIPLAFAAAVAALGVYIVQVLASVKGTTDDKAVVRPA